ncbi:Transposon Ty3-G Gag-Pol polyprotein [Araneus ventricosus]|uniref:RNA-directed DNA polymerase n=1 Tax=Araneus ventricosus TaxID=182803 RepID=A0A4Y2MX23_ARAVE|nr:Transposon Ty3-G Gag-Pol polyprotein [Araneus ventricosus]
MQEAEDVMIGVPDSSTITKVAVVDRKPEEVAGEPAMPGNELNNLRMEESRLGKDMRDEFSRLLAISGDPDVIANVSKPIIGADFLKHYGLLIDLKNSCIRDPLTKFSSKGIVIENEDKNITFISSSAKFHDILNAYKDIMCPYPSSPKPKHNTVHRIITNGQPVFSRPRRLNPKHLAIARHEFQTMMEQGLCRPSVQELSFLGYLVNELGSRPMPVKIAPIVNYDRPRTVKDLRRYLGLLNYYCRNIPRAAHVQALLTDYLRDPHTSEKNVLIWAEESIKDFVNSRQQLANATLLFLPSPDAQLTLYVDASDFVLGAALHQIKDSGLQPLGIFSRKLTETEKKYSAYNRELLAAYSAIKHFRFMLEGRTFVLYTVHKPLTYAFMQKSDKCSPRQLRHLDFISQFTTDIRHVTGVENIPADTLSRTAAIACPTPINYQDMDEAQSSDRDLQTYLANPSPTLQLKRLVMPNSSVELSCDTSTDKVRPFVPLTQRKKIFETLHGISHPGRKATVKLIADRFVWPNIRADCEKWAKACIPCQRSKIMTHTKSPITNIPV